ncbi:MAG: GNAT family N-acetyltransferase [Proteobacteria bacterium]|nr:GNAT family N-acetyltransferase [Pseudomonadota bacterium]
MLPPEPLAAHHAVAGFSNGKHPSLDAWLKKRALAGEGLSARTAGEGLSARTYVVCSGANPSRVVGYYAISTAMEEPHALPTARLRRNMPSQIPLLLIGRLALDSSVQGRGLGADLLADAVRRCCAASEIVGARAIVAHAIDDHAMRFYAHHGFLPSPLGERVMLLPIETAAAVLMERGR